MTPNSLRQEVENCLDLMNRMGICLVHNPVVCEQSGRKSRVTWRAPEGLSDTLSNEFHFASIEEYCCHLRNQAFSAVLFDGAILQVSFDFFHNRLVGHRLCFYPCPFNIAPEDFDGEPILDVVELFKVAAIDRLALRSPVRFDYDPRNANDGHPSVHAHFLWGPL